MPVDEEDNEIGDGIPNRWLKDFVCCSVYRCEEGVCVLRIQIGMKLSPQEERGEGLASSGPKSCWLRKR